MELLFKKPSEKARETMANASFELGNRKRGNEYIKLAEESIKNFTAHEHSRVLCSGNAAIMVAMSNMEGPVMIPDQGGWSGFIKIAEFYGLKLIRVPTKMGVIDLEILKDHVKQKNPDSLFITSFAGYMAEQPVKEIYEICEDHEVIMVEDASGSVGDPLKNLACGDHAHIIVASTGYPKIVNVGNGGFISTNNPKVFEDAHYLIKTVKSSPVICAGLVEEIKKAPESLTKTLQACEFLKKEFKSEEIKSVLHPKKRGINIALSLDEPKLKARELRTKIRVKGGGMITVCPRYDRINQPAICLEIKNLDTQCLEKNNLREIVKIVEKTI
jgi:hypothetical protein